MKIQVLFEDEFGNEVEYKKTFSEESIEPDLSLIVDEMFNFLMSLGYPAGAVAEVIRERIQNG